MQTPIPITTSVPKRAKSQKKKALAAALATAQEYSEISMEQKKLQVCSAVPPLSPAPVVGEEEYQLAVAPLYSIIARISLYRMFCRRYFFVFISM